MSDPQQFGLGELGQRVQAMADPAVPATAPASGSTAGNASPDPRLRPYQGAPLPIGSLSSRGPLPSYGPLEDLRTPPPAAPAPAPSPKPFPAASQPSAPNSTRSFDAPPSTPPSWEQVAVPAPPPATETASAESASASQAENPAAGASHAPPAQPAGGANSGETPKSGLQRVLDAVRSTIPIVQKLLPLLDGNFATAIGALVAPQQHHAPPPVQVDLEPVERSLAEVRNTTRELRNQVVEQGASLKRVEDQLERVREATDRNTLEQQELVEDLRAVGNRVSTFAIAGLILLLISLALNGFLLFQLQHILR